MPPTIRLSHSCQVILHSLLWFKAAVVSACLAQNGGQSGKEVRFPTPQSIQARPSESRIEFSPATLDQPTSYAIRSVTSHNGVFVAVGSRSYLVFAASEPTGPGAVWISANGRDWRVTHTNELGLYAVASSAGRLVATADGGALLISSDGEDWETVLSGGTNTLRGITYGNGMWVGVGYRGTVATSRDGINWTVPDKAVESRYNLTAVTFGGGRFVAVGALHLLGHTFSSSDGVTWSATKLPGLPYVPFGIAYGNGRFVAVGGGGGVDISTDGASWTRASGSGWHVLGEATYAQGRFLVPSQFGVRSSRDGTRWLQDFRVPPNTEHLRSIAYHNGTYVAVGLNGLIMYAEGSEPYLDQIEKRDGSIGISFSGGTEPRYAVETTTSLDSASWSRLGEVLTTDGVGVLQDPNAGQFPQRFYRIVSAKPTPSAPE